MRSVKVIAAALLIGSSSLAMSVPAVSAPLSFNHASVVAGAPSLTENVRWRGHRGFHRGYRGYRHGYRHYHHGGGAGALIGGLAAGAIIGGAIAAGSANAAANSVAYCEQRYQSYDPASGTYLGYDGLRHPCP